MILDPEAFWRICYSEFIYKHLQINLNTDRKLKILHRDIKKNNPEG